MGIYVTDTERGVRVVTHSTFLRHFCEGWIERMKEYANAVPDDWPFWYGERALVGFLAGGIWTSDCVCIEEYLTDKKPHIAESPNESYLGWGDLYFNTGSREGKVEFKMHNVGISRTDHFTQFLKKKWREGKLDAKRATKEGIDRWAGIFLRPYVGKGRDLLRYDANLKLLLGLAWDVVKPDALAWWCPTTSVIKANEKDTKDWVVGAILLMKQVK